MLATPIIFIFFNRPDVTRRTFAVIRAQRPRRLYLIADGPRPDRPTDAARCRETREIVERMIDWECEVTRDYSEKNLGCGRRLSSGLTAAFALLGEAIVLEDDILPHPDFFTFCATQLALHRDNPRIHAITGFNPLGRYLPRGGPAVPTIFNSIWGWASWQRAWKDYRFDLAAWRSAELQAQIRAYVGSELTYQFFAHKFDEMVTTGIDTWDFQWTFAMLKERRYTLVSSTNLIENIGFTADATHTTSAEAFLHGLRVHALTRHPQRRPIDQPDRLHDKLYAQVVMDARSSRRSLARFIAGSPLLARLATSLEA